MLWPTGSKWQCKIFHKAYLSHDQPTESEQHPKFSESEPHFILFYHQQLVGDIAHLSERQSPYILSYDQQEVSDIAHFSKQSLHILYYGQQEVSNIAHVSERQCCHILS